MAEPNPEELAGLGLQNYYKQDFTQAKKYFEKSCDLNISRGCGALGVLYYNGQGVEKDLIKAAQYISKACKLGDQKACEALKEK
ncbi:tetratricopeptide repeat protein [Helicobacter pylori]|uniref:tetratricopeptide repeat protein n=1 Tax=Helicobacter pylori TaxID=210 RepID=UPI001126EB0B|nr:SEL1-like repeat protein [Helicobacter pylori]TPH32639.1 sel1 repeat family protein [Helicobacter pylori]